MNEMFGIDNIFRAFILSVHDSIRVEICVKALLKDFMFAEDVRIYLFDYGSTILAEKR